jgi:hypothetical protein
MAAFDDILDHPFFRPEPNFNKQRLVNLIRLLATPVDGERLGAVCAIDRILQSAGLSFHDLASAVAGSSLQVDTECENANSWIEAGAKMLDGYLRDHERQFVEQMVSRFSTNPSFAPSDKQMKWFVSLYRRMERQHELQESGK